MRGSITAKVHELVTPFLSPGDVVVDATLGNGYDYEFLRYEVGSDGRVYGIDVQQEALTSTRDRLLLTPETETPPLI